MVQDSPVQWVLEDGSVLGTIIRKDRPNGWPISNFLYQPSLENKLEDLLARYPNVTKQRGRELLSFTQDEAGVTLSHAASRGVRYGRDEAIQARPEKVDETRVRWLVACDGGRSTVRTQLGINMTGKSFPEPWLVVDIKEKPGTHSLRHMPYFNFYCDPKQPTVSCPQPNRHHRFEFQLMGDTTREQMEDPANIRRLLSRHVDPDKVEILRALVYTFNALVAERWRDGRVLLAGDAAHMTPQFMGQGMSSGLRDAYNLAWKLNAVIKGDAAAGLIDSYEMERSPHAQAMVAISVRNKQFVSMPNPMKARLRNIAMRAPLASRGPVRPAARLPRRPLSRPSAQVAQERRGQADPAADGADLRRSTPSARRHDRRQFRADRPGIGSARRPRRRDPGRAGPTGRELCRAVSVRRPPAGGLRDRRKCLGACVSRRHRDARRDRGVHRRGRRLAALCWSPRRSRRDHPAGQVRLRARARRGGESRRRKAVRSSGLRFPSAFTIALPVLRAVYAADGRRLPAGTDNPFPKVWALLIDG